MKKILFIHLIVLSLAITITPVFAAEDQFIVSQVVMSSPDLTPPSAPTSLTATAVSSSQINLSWTASTDNTSVAGYVVYRDSLAVATSTMTSYSDTGLTPETLYTYTIRAFDPSFNYSAYSATSTATTQAEPVTPSTSSPNTGSSGGYVITVNYMNVSPSQTEAIIGLGTTPAVQVTVSWGETVDYELGSSSGSLFLTEQVIRLSGLTPSTRYFFKLDVTDGQGRHRTISGQEFTTTAVPDVFAPSNVSNFLATPNEKTIVLTWNNPKTDFALVRIVRSDKYYPRDPLDGEIVYEGRGERFVDGEVTKEKTYYYSAFTKDAFSNYSSGAITDGRLLRPGETFKMSEPFAGVIKLSSNLIHPLLKSLKTSDLIFTQNGTVLPVESDMVDVHSDQNLIISLRYDKVPEILKTIAITMHDSEDYTKTFSFLLRINADKSAYEANIGPLERAGKYRFDFAILDYKHQGLALLNGTIVAHGPNQSAFESDDFNQTLTSMILFGLLLILIGVVVSVVISVVVKLNRFINGISDLPPMTS